MIDIFTVVLPHVLMAMAVWQLIHRDDLDLDPMLPGSERALSRLKKGFASAKDRKPHAMPPKENGPDGKTPRA